MSDLLTPDEVRESSLYQVSTNLVDMIPEERFACRICRDYLTLWDRNKGLEAEVEDLKNDAGMVTMTDRVLTAEEVQRIISSRRSIPEDIADLIVSHRLQAEMVKQYAIVAHRLSQDYLTLVDRNKELEEALRFQKEGPLR